MKDFDFYQIVGVIAPGMVVVVGGLFLFYPAEQKNLISIASVSIGSLGVGVILAYVVGQLLQAVGNGIESIWWWLWRGMPTDWIRTGRHNLIAPAQRSHLQERLKCMLNDKDFTIENANRTHWFAITRQVYAAVSAANRASRVDIFNGNYGLCRGITAGFTVLLVAFAIINLQSWKTELILGILIALSVFRMHRFGVHYGREVFVQYLQAQDASEPRKQQ